LQKLPEVLRDAAWDVTVTVWDGKQVVDVEPGYVDDSYGWQENRTTTVVGYLMSMRTGQTVAIGVDHQPQVASRHRCDDPHCLCHEGRREPPKDPPEYC
jgi:hypothetical protein